MHITYHGLSCFKIVAKTEGRGSKDVTIVFSPYDKKLGLRPPQGNANAVFIPHPNEMFNNPDILRGEPVVVNKPGEYSIEGLNIIGLDAPADPRDGIDRGNTVVFTLNIEDMKIAYLGALGMEPSTEIFDKISGADILFVPVGDTEGLDAKTAEVIARKVEAKIIIPMQYKVKGLKVKTLRDEKDFCSEIGNCPKSKEEKLTLKKKDLENKVMEVVLMKVS
ncbi:MAG: MBL fold metallo-hydrolase [Candidatus Moraniibacteriota bacterium]|jgi:beta-lactamase family protein